MDILNKWLNKVRENINEPEEQSIDNIQTKAQSTKSNENS